MPVTTGGKVLLITGGALITYLVGREVFAKPAGRPAPKPEPKPEPTPDVTGLIEQFESMDGQPQMGTLYDYGPEIAAMANVARYTLRNAGVPDNSANRIQYMRLIECSPYNDALYNVRLSEQSFKARFRNDQPFGISGNPQHYDNIMRMKQGFAPRRAANRNSMTQTTEQVPGGRRHADLWLPLLKPGTTVVGPASVADWQDGSSAINPPPEILALGFENVPPGEYGCAPWRTSVEAL